MESALRHDISRAIPPRHRRHPNSLKTHGLRNTKARTRRQFGTIILVTVGVVTEIGHNTHHEAPLSMTGLKALGWYGHPLPLWLVQHPAYPEEARLAITRRVRSHLSSPGSLWNQIIRSPDYRGNLILTKSPPSDPYCALFVAYEC